MNELIQSDKDRWAGTKRPWLIPQYRFVVLKRYCEVWKPKNSIIYYFFRILYIHCKTKYVTDIPSGVKVGKGLRIEHLGGIVINPEAVLGDNITLLNGVLIGSQIRGEYKGTPTIGDRVWIGTNAIIVGKVNIGDDVLVAPGAYINFNVPSNSIVLGNPGRIIQRKNPTKEYTINPV